MNSLTFNTCLLPLNSKIKVQSNAILRCSVICRCYQVAPLQVLVHCRGAKMESHLHFANTTYHGIVSFYIKEFPYFRGTSAWRLALMKV